MTVQLYYKTLEQYSLVEISSAMKIHLRDPVEGRFTPKPAHIIGILNVVKKQILEKEFYKPINMNRPPGTRGSYEKGELAMKKIKKIISDMNLIKRKGK